MAEQEELQLRVSLDDQASAQLAALRGQLDQMRGSGGAGAIAQQAAPQIVAAIAPVVQQLTAMVEQLAQLPTQITAAMSGAVQGLQQVQTQLTQVSTQVQQSAQAVAGIPGHVAQGTQALGTAIRQAGFFGGIAAGVTQEFIGQLSQLGNNLIQRSTDFKGLAASMQDVETHAKGVGMSMTGYIGQQRALQIGGMTPEQATATISRMADLNLELKQYGAENAPTTLRMTRITDPETTDYIIKTMKAMEGADLPKQIQLINQLHDAIQKSMTAAGNARGFEAAWKELSENMGITAEAFAGLDYSKYEEFQRLEQQRDTPERKQMFRDRTEETKKFNRESLIASFLWKDIGESIAASLLHGIELTGAAGELNTWLDRILTDAEAFEKAWRDVDFAHALEQLGQMEPAIKPFTDEIKTFVTKDLKDLEKSLNDILTWEHSIGKASKEPDVGTKIQRRELESRGWSDEQIDKYFKDHPLPEDTRKPYTFGDVQKKYEEFKNWLHGGKQRGEAEPEGGRDIFNLGRGPGATEEELQRYEREHGVGPPPPPPPPPPPSPPPGPTELTPEQQERYRRRFGRGQRQSYEEGVGQPNIVPASYEEGTGKPIIVPASMVQAQPVGAVGGGQQVSPADMAALVESAQPEEGGQPSGLHPGVQLAGYKSRVASEIAEQLTTPKGLIRSGADLAEMAKGSLEPKAPTAIDTLLSILPGGLSAIPEFLKQHEGAGDPLLGKLRFMLGIPDANVPTPAPWAKGGAWHPGQNEGADQAEGFDKRFGIWPGMGADKLDQTSNKLDQAANTNVNISGAGKIQVDVRAPPGTSVDAAGEGFFKSTEITRLTQMLPADMGPLPMTGVGAGQGVAGNGTVGA